jgi:hypothetical protein
MKLISMWLVESSTKGKKDVGVGMGEALVVGGSPFILEEEAVAERVNSSIDFLLSESIFR